jgi:uncharacterized protein with FMN-binding domain
MKRAPLFVLAGTVAGFAGVLGFHSRPASSAAPGSHPAATGASRSGNGGPAALPSAPSAAAGAGGPARTATGATEQYGYGQLAVKVTVAGTRITSVSVPAIQTAEPYSQQLATQVIPMLRSEVLAGQNARIHGVSGATYTSEAYAMSLQSALDKLHVK